MCQILCDKDAFFGTYLHELWFIIVHYTQIIKDQYLQRCKGDGTT